jgi:cytochrome b
MQASSSPTSSTRAASPGPLPRTATRRVTDAPTRMFHWLFALSFAGAYLTAESERWRLVHVQWGYVFAGLLVFRVAYGWLGPRQASLGLLWRRVVGARAWVQSLFAARTLSTVNWRQAQNLAMAMAIVAMLLLVTPLLVSGYGSYNEWGDIWGGDALEEAHEWLGNALLVLALAHIAGLAGLSAQRRQNQALPMLTGRIKGQGPDLVPHNRVWLAVLLLVAVLAFGLWPWWSRWPG